jgi:hypothetical protein
MPVLHASVRVELTMGCSNIATPLVHKRHQFGHYLHDARYWHGFVPVLVAITNLVLFCACFAQGTLSSADNSSDSAYYLVRASAIATFQNDISTLEQLYREAKSVDRIELRRSAFPYQLHDNILALKAACTPERTARLELARQILKERPDVLLKCAMVSCVKSDELNQAARLKREITYNHIADLFNRLSHATSALASGRFQPLVQFAGGLPFFYRKLLKITPRERKILLLTKSFMKKNPEDPNKEMLIQRSERLEKKRKVQQARLAAVESKRLHSEGLLDDALFYGDQACYLRPNSQKFQKQRLDILRDISGMRRHKIDEVAVLNVERFVKAPDEEALYRRLLYALVRNDQADVARTSLSFTERLPTSSYADEAAYVHTLFTADPANPEQLTQRLLLFARKHPHTNMSQHAETTARSPFVTMLAAYQRERARYHHRLTTYLLLGRRTEEARFHMTESEALPFEDRLAEYAGVVLVTDMLMRGLKLALANPISREAVVERAVSYIHRYPDTNEAKELAVEVARYYEKQACDEAALYYYALADQLTSQCVMRVENSSFRRLYALAHRAQSPELRVHILREIQTRYPDSKLVSKVKKELEEIEETPIIEGRIAKSVFQARPSLWNREGLPLQQKLFDGNRRNGEMTEEGVTIFSNNQLQYFVYGESHPRSLEITAETRRLLLSLAGELQYQQRIQSKMTARYRQPRFPVEVTGSIGQTGVEAFPTLRTLEYKDEDLPLYK